ncbi:unnamed protein product [Scytosiphon promiscuus]
MLPAATSIGRRFLCATAAGPITKPVAKSSAAAAGSTAGKIGREIAAKCDTNAASGVLRSSAKGSRITEGSSARQFTAITPGGPLVRRVPHGCGTGSSGRQETAWTLVVASAAAVAAAAALSQQQLRLGVGQQGAGGGACLCKGKSSPEDSLQDYARRLQRLSSLRDIFEEYASVNTDDVGKLMTCGDFLRAMLCYKYVRVGAKEVKRRCARYINPLLGDEHGLISFDEFCFLLNLLSIPAGLFDVAFAAADADGSGTIDAEELQRLVKRLAPPEDEDGDGGDSKGKDDQTGHKRLMDAWFGKQGGAGGKAKGKEEGGGSGGGGEEGIRVVAREKFAAFVRDLRMDVKTVECRLYSLSIRVDEDEAKAPATKRRGWLAWAGLGGSDRRGGKSPRVGHGAGGGDDPAADGAGSGWWTRYEHETISMADLALTLVSACHPRDMPMFLTRVQAIQKKRKQIPLKDALLLHEVLEDHAEDLEDALGMYSKASSGGAVEMADFARAAKVISGKELSPECVWLVFKMFDKGADGRLEHDELIEATHERLRRLPGQRESIGKAARFVQCVRGGA